jgi:uncharacterized membrane protein
MIADKMDGGNREFLFRGHEVRRIEAFSDAVFAFAVTLLIVSLEVPKNFEELMVTMRGFFAFGVSFVLLMMVWYEQNIFFRRYGLDDLRTIVLNCMLIFVVLFYVYPLKFLFTLLFSGQIYGEHSPFVMKITDVPMLMIIYGIGYILIYFLFFLMYSHALRKAEYLQLTPAEIFDTQTKKYKNLILIAVGIVSVIVACLVAPERAGIAGWIYVLIGPALSFFYSWRKKQKLKLNPSLSKTEGEDL